MAQDPAAQKKTVKEPRKLKTGEYHSFRLQKPLKTQPANLSSSFSLFRGAIEVLWHNWKPFFGIILIFGILNFILVQSFRSNDLSSTKTTLDSFTSGGHWSQLMSGFALFVYMASSSGNLNSPVAGAYQLILTLICSLALIWTLRQAYAGHMVRARDGFYRGMYPLIPFALVLLVSTLQLAPVILGAYLYNLASTGGIAQGNIEAALWAVLFFMAVVITLYMLCASLLALYIVCLPDMTPGAALRSAQELVKNRRWTIMRKIIFLPVALMIVALAIVLPFILLVAPVAGLAFFLVSMFLLPVVHSYMYRLYRELL